MTIAVTSLDELSESDIKAQQTLLSSLLAEKYPEIDFQRGVFHDLVCYLNAVFSAKTALELEKWKNSRSLLAITQNPELADDDSVDHILSNYNITRKTGKTASGKVMLEFSKDINYIIPSGFTLTYNDLTFKTTKSYSISPSGVARASADVALSALSSGNYGCLISVTADSAGSSGCLKKNTVLSANSSYSTLVTAYAYDDFIGGEDTETNEAVISRLSAGLATPTWGNRRNIESLLRNSEDFPSLVDVSVVGFGDEEMLRDQMTIFPVSCGGKTDIYVKPCPYMSTVTFEDSATVIETDGINVKWMIPIQSAWLPGAWRAISVFPTDSDAQLAECTIVSQEIESTDDRYADSEVALSAYQRIVLTFKTQSTYFSSKTVGSDASFTITVEGFPLIDSLQDTLSTRELVPVASDVLVKGAVPCLVSPTVHIKANSGVEVTEEQIKAIRESLTSYINSTGFAETITTAQLAILVQAQLIQGQITTRIQLTGAILAPNNFVWRETSASKLTIPYYPLNGVTSATTVFMSSEDYVDIVTE